jgi:hypothetical protein
LETNDIKKLLLNGTDPIEENPFMMPSVKPMSEKSNVIAYSRSLNEDEVIEESQTKVLRKSSLDAATEHQENDAYENGSR